MKFKYDICSLFVISNGLILYMSCMVVIPVSMMFGWSIRVNRIDMVMLL